VKNSLKLILILNLFRIEKISSKEKHNIENFDIVEMI
jgi:hypothetical protein